MKKFFGWFFIILGILDIIRAAGMEYANDNYKGWMFIWGIVFIVIGIWMLSSSSKKKNDVKNNDSIANENEQSSNINISSIFFDQTTISKNEFEKQEATLLKLYNDKILNESEYTEKLNQIKRKKEEEINTTKKLEFEEKLQKTIAPHIKLLQELKNTNILTEAEFNDKKESVENKYRAELLEELSSVVSDIELMEKHRITFYNGSYYYDIYCYDNLKDAVNYAILDEQTNNKKLK